MQMSRSEHQEEGDLIEYYTYPEQEYKTINVQAKRKPTGEVFDHLIKMIEEEEEAIPSMEDVYKSMEAALKGDGMVDRSLF